MFKEEFVWWFATPYDESVSSTPSLLSSFTSSTKMMDEGKTNHESARWLRMKQKLISNLEPSETKMVTELNLPNKLFTMQTLYRLKK